jgi:nucleotide-binding universal stress UspA family protein
VVHDSLIEDAQAAFAEGKRYLENRNVPYQATLLQGEAVELILQHAKLNHCDMIVMGSYDRSFLKNLLLGSTTEELLSKVNLPTLLMR